jgi:hypothetical protein
MFSTAAQTSGNIDYLASRHKNASSTARKSVERVGKVQRGLARCWVLRERSRDTNLGSGPRKPVRAGRSTRPYLENCIVNASI